MSNIEGNPPRQPAPGLAATQSQPKATTPPASSPSRPSSVRSNSSLTYVTTPESTWEPALPLQHADAGTRASSHSSHTLRPASEASEHGFEKASAASTATYVDASPPKRPPLQRAHSAPAQLQTSGQPAEAKPRRVYQPPPRTDFRHGIQVATQKFVRTRMGHAARKQPLTLEGVSKLQNSTRMNRRAGRRIGKKWGAAMGGFVGILSAAALGPFGFVMFPFTGIAGTLGGFALGSLLGLGIGHVEKAQVHQLRKHGLYYTGVTGSKQEAANMWRSLAQAGFLATDRSEQGRETFRLVANFSAEKVQEVRDFLIGGKLPTQLVDGVVSYLTLAQQAVENSRRR